MSYISLSVRYCLCLLVFLTASMLTQAQETLSFPMPSLTEGAVVEREETTEELSFVLPKSDSLQIAKSKKLAGKLSDSWQPKSGKALLWAILPGGGQIYNRKYWKLPIVWGGLMTCAYFISFNNRMYQEYHAAYRDLMSADPSQNTAWLAFAPQGALATDYAQYESLKGTLKRGNDYYRRYRDLSIVLAIGIYGLSMLDAYVDAELFTFDISPDLSMRVAPTLVPNSSAVGSKYKVGLGCQLTF